MWSATRRRPASFVAAGTTIVNCAPPSGQFSAQTRPCSTASSPRAIERPMPVPDDGSVAAAPRIEPLEQVRQVGRRDAGAVIAHRDDQALGRRRGR